MINGLPSRLKCLRQKYNLSQRCVAQQLGVSPSIISGYETGERTPSLENLLALAYLYKCSTDYLLGRSLQEPATIIDTTTLTNEQIQAINSLIQTIHNKSN